MGEERGGGIKPVSMEAEAQSQLMTTNNEEITTKQVRPRKDMLCRLAITLTETGMHFLLICSMTNGSCDVFHIHFSSIKLFITQRGKVHGLYPKFSDDG